MIEIICTDCKKRTDCYTVCVDCYEKMWDEIAESRQKIKELEADMEEMEECYVNINHL